MISFGRINKFYPVEETMDSYLERIEIFFIANGIAAEKQAPVLLSVISTCSSCKSLIAASIPFAMSFACANVNSRWESNRFPL